MMEDLIARLWRHKFAAIICLIACTAFYAFFVNRAHVDLTIEVEKRTVFKIYWAEEGEHFSERKMAQVLVKPERQNYSLTLTNLKNISRLRIDPQEFAGRSVISKLIIKQNGYSEISLASSEEFAQLKPLAQIRTHSTEGNKLETVSSGKDANYLLELQVQPERFDWTSFIISCLFVCFFILLIYASIYHLGFAYRYIPVMLLVVFVLAAVMALISERNVHPDEYVHIAASRYYQSNWFPPEIGDPSVAETYSVYGVSRLNTSEISYLFCGKVAGIIAPLKLTDHISFRIFNLLLLGLILLYTLQVPDSRLVAVPLLISPQVWYLFSYCNSDAFAIAISFFVGCQVVVRESALNRFLARREGLRQWGNMLVAAFFFGVLFVLKANYLVFNAFLFWVLLLNMWQEKEWDDRKIFLRRVIAVCVVGLSLMAVKVAADYHINGFDRKAKIIAMRDKIAAPLYNPHTPLEKQHANLYMKKRGIPLSEIIHKDRWFEKTFRSAFGVYGYSTISAGFGYYDLVRWTGISFLAAFLLSLLIRSGLYVNLQVFAAVILSAALVSVSLYHSWTKDFQAQGRYLIPILPMLGVLCAQGRNAISPKIITLFTTAMFLLSAYSYICVALLDIPRLLRI